MSECDTNVLSSMYAHNNDFKIKSVLKAEISRYTWHIKDIIDQKSCENTAADLIS